MLHSEHFRFSFFIHANQTIGKHLQPFLGGQRRVVYHKRAEGVKGVRREKLKIFLPHIAGIRGIMIDFLRMGNSIRKDIMKHRFFISVYTIAKNEEQIVKRWYDCFQEADEVVVLVNNSTDNTAKALRALGARVTVKKYKKFRFDKARNDAMALCSPKADLLLAVDMDDMVEKGWRKKLENAWELGLRSGRGPNCLLYTYSVIWGVGKTNKQSFLRHSIHTQEGWFWKGRVHEYLENDTRKAFVYYPKFEIESHPVKQEHSAYLGLLEEDASEKDCEARTIHLLGREYMLRGRVDDAISMLKRFLNHVGATWRSERAATMKYLSACYAQKGDEVSRELWLWKAMEEDPNDKDAPFDLGMLLVKKKDYKQAIRILQRCLAITEPHLDYPYFLLDAWGPRPWLCLAEAYYYDGEWEEAKTAISEALKIDSECTLAKTMMAEIELAQQISRPRRPPPEVPRERIVIPELES